MRRPHADRNDTAEGGRITLLAFCCAAAWAFAVSVGYFQLFGDQANTAGMLVAFGAAAIGPIILIMFSALSARAATRASAQVERIADLAETAMIAPNMEVLSETRDVAAALRGEVEALDQIVHVAAKRLDAFEAGLRADGGKIARALAEDIETMSRVRHDLNKETVAVGETIHRHVEALHKTSVIVREETNSAAATIDSQLEAFGAVSAQIGVRSAEFAAAANASAGSSQKLDDAVAKALEALAHATSLTDTARKSAEEAAFVAHEAAGAVRGATRTAVAEARDAAKRIRAEGGGAPPSFFPRLFAGASKLENISPPGAPAQSTADVIEMKRPAKTADALPLAPLKPAPARTLIHIDAQRTLADIVTSAGVTLTSVLSSEKLDLISQAAALGADARRQAVRAAAPEAIRALSQLLRRDAHTRREAEVLRREPGRALGAVSDDPRRRRELASAYLLIDTVLG